MYLVVAFKELLESGILIAPIRKKTYLGKVVLEIGIIVVMISYSNLNIYGNYYIVLNMYFDIDIENNIFNISRDLHKILHNIKIIEHCKRYIQKIILLLN
jgi:hypothetical protein